MRIRKRIAIPALLLVLLAVLTAFLNPILEGSLKAYLSEKLVVHNRDARYALDYQTLELNIFRERLRLGGLRVRSTTSVDSAAPGDRLQQLLIPQVTLSGIGLTHFLWADELELHAIEFDSLMVRLDKHRESVETKKGGVRIDSIKLPGFSAFKLGAFSIGHFQLQIRDSSGQDTLARFHGNDLLLKGVAFAETERGDREALIPGLTGLELELGPQKYNWGNGLYGLDFESFHYRFEGGRLRIDSLSMNPEGGEETFAQRNVHSYEMYTAACRSLEITDLDLAGLLDQGRLHMGSVRIDGLNAQIFRDKTRPYDTGRNVAMPTQALAGIDFEIRSDSVVLDSAYLGYYERLPDTDQHVEVSFHELFAVISNIRTTRQALEGSDTLKVALRSNLLEAVPVSLDLRMPYASDRVLLSGRTSGSSRLHQLNPTIYPALNMRFSGGRLDGIYFTASGNYHRMRGELEMLYTDLEVELLDPDHDTRKTLSWLANTLVKNSNPNRRGKTIVGMIDFERTPYKGVWNYVWKSVQSGVVNTLNPLGERRRE